MNDLSANKSIEENNADSRPVVYLRPLLESDELRESDADIPIIFGHDSTGRIAMMDLAEAPHILIGGAIGSGKSVCMNTLIMNLIFRFSPDELRLVMIDPKVVELDMYRTLSHLITPIMNDSQKVPQLLSWCVKEMERRYMALAKVKANDLNEFNTRPHDSQPVFDDRGNEIPRYFPLLIVLINELSDLMMLDAKNDVEQSICNLAQKGHIVGIHLVIMTSALRKDVVTERIKANIPTRIALQVTDGKVSLLILDEVGAEKLLGNGDMLLKKPGVTKPERIQGAYISESEIEEVIEKDATQEQQIFIYNPASKSEGQEDDHNDEDTDCAIDNIPNPEIIKAMADKYLEPDDPPIMLKALEVVFNAKQVSTSYLQRNLHIGYNQAAEIIDKLEQRHVISAPQHEQQKRTLIIDGMTVVID